MTATFTPQQVDDAIRAGLRGSRRDFALSPGDAADKGDAYRGNLAHYRDLAQKCLADGDYRQAAEKSWGAYAQTIKVIAAAHGMNVETHRSLLRVAQELNALAGSADPAIADWLDHSFHTARSLHQHFYENDLPDASVIKAVRNVLDAIDLLQTLI